MDRFALTFDSNIVASTPGMLRTQVIRGVDPQLTCRYKSAVLEQYFEETSAQPDLATLNAT